MLKCLHSKHTLSLSAKAQFEFSIRWTNECSSPELRQKTQFQLYSKIIGILVLQLQKAFNVAMKPWFFPRPFDTRNNTEKTSAVNLSRMSLAFDQFQLLPQSTNMQFVSFTYFFFGMAFVWIKTSLEHMPRQFHG